MTYTEKTIKSEEIYNGKVVHLKKLTVDVCGKEAIREIVEHPGGVCVLARNNDGKILFVRQFRKAVEKELLEIPAGKLEYGEDPRECGLRELREETGCTCGVFEKITQIYPTPGYCNEIIHIYFADKLKKGEQDLDEDEFLSVESYSYQQALSMVKNGEITDAKTVIALLMGKEFLA